MVLLLRRPTKKVVWLAEQRQSVSKSRERLPVLFELIEQKQSREGAKRDSWSYLGMVGRERDPHSC